MAELLAGTNPVLFDFDGPICSIFAGSPAADVAHNLRDVAVKLGAVPDEAMGEEDDPLEILRWSARAADASILVAVENALIAAEVAAVGSADPTPFAEDVLRSLHCQGRTIGIASNNSVPAIEKYLGVHEMRSMVTAVAGRRPYSPDLMKPHPMCLQAVTTRLQIDPTDCVYIGDSWADIQAAHSIGMQVVAYANKPGKFAQFITAGADAVIRSMGEIA